MDKNKSRWPQAMAECLSAFLREQVGLPCPVVDYELITDPRGDPDDMRVWFICRSKEEKINFNNSERSRAVSVLKKKMIEAGFSDSAVASITIQCTSREEVEKRGGRFDSFD